LSPGVVAASNNVGGYSVNGQRDRNNNFMLDGADNNDTAVPGGQQGISAANPDSTQEFRVITNNFDAEFGRNTGAIVDVVTRGGSNRFHGNAYEFGRYNALGARDFFNKKENGPQDPYVRNDFGASIGGPLWKDRTFFFLNGEAQRFRTTRTTFQTTPTAAFRTGKFTYTDPIEGSQTPVDLTADPMTNWDNYSGLGQDPLVAKILALAPIGQADNGDGVSTTYFFPSPDAYNAYSLTGRLDHKLTNKHQLTVRYIYGHSAESNPFHDEVLPGYGDVSGISTNHNGVVSIASSLSARATNVLRAGYNQVNSGDYCNHAAIDALTGTDTFGNVVLEALASGVPAVVTGDGGPKYIVRDGETGFIAADEAFPSAIARLMQDRTLLQTMRGNARTYALGCSWDAVFEKVYEGYLTALPPAQFIAPNTAETSMRK